MKTWRWSLSTILVGLGAATVVYADLLSFSERERAVIASFGPWPVLPPTDPTNPGSGRQVGIDLGEKLFFDERLSVNGKIACASCHEPERHWTDGLRRGVGVARGDRNTPSLMNMAFHRRFGWDGVNDKLWMQSLRPIVDARELGSSAQHLARLVRSDADYSCRFQKVFGRPVPSQDDEVLVDTGRALAAFMEGLSSGRAPFDEFRDALVNGDTRQAAQYSEAAQRGVKLFVGKAACVSCHDGPIFTNGERRDNGMLSGSPDLLQAKRSSMQFRVASLRHLALTGPYMHDGSLTSLAEVLNHYERTSTADVKPLTLAPKEKTDLLVFLESLTNFRAAIWRSTDGGAACK